eukprot:m.32870 g.32870  ORF g.32870 m.32870 type:complete len:331 (+) comp4939_c0_seq1:48-1040(+)
MAQAAGRAASQLYAWTSCVRSAPLSERLGCNVWMKLDCEQPSGSFKLRGLSNAVTRAAAQGATSIVSSSGGNAGLAAAYAAKKLNLPCTIFVPDVTPAKVIAMLQGHGANTIVAGTVWDEANERAIVEAEKTGGALVHPFDHPDVWDGNATLISELAVDLPVKPDAIVTVCGGGGLLMGILQGLERMGAGWESIPVLVVETEGADSLYQSLAARELVTLPSITSVAKSLGARRVSETMFNKCLELGDDKVVSWRTTDQAAVRACATFYKEHNILVEPACGAGLSAVYEGAALLGNRAETDTIVVEVCGGALMDEDALNRMRGELGVDTLY